MTAKLNRIFLDTNVYIIGAVNKSSAEAKILDWLGFQQKVSNAVEVIISEELIDQVVRVAKRLRNKDWSGNLINQIWRNLNVCCVVLDEKAFCELEKQAIIPREDIGVYLTAQSGKAECFVSRNYKLIRSLVEETEEFECLTPVDFVTKYVVDDA